MLSFQEIGRAVYLALQFVRFLGQHLSFILWRCSIFDKSLNSITLMLRCFLACLSFRYASWSFLLVASSLASNGWSLHFLFCPKPCDKGITVTELLGTSWGFVTLWQVLSAFTGLESTCLTTSSSLSIRSVWECIVVAVLLKHSVFVAWTPAFWSGAGSAERNETRPPSFAGNKLTDSLSLLSVFFCSIHLLILKKLPTAAFQ